MTDSKLNRRNFAKLTAASLVAPMAASASEQHTDLCVYGATASGIMTAVTASKDGWKVTIIESSRWLGGMTGGGLDHVDWGREEAVGGSTRPILERELGDAGYRELFQQMLAEHGVEVIYEHRLNAVRKAGTTIEAIELDHAPPDETGCPVAEPQTARALTIAAKVFVDCSYEGDLMAAAGVSCTWGRESRDEYGESLAGVRPNLWEYAIDPYRTPGDPDSGLLPLLQDVEVNPLGAADKLTMGYCFRYKFTTEGNGWPLDPPEDYDPFDYEIFRRAFAGGVNLMAQRKMRFELGEITEQRSKPYLMNTGNLVRSLLTTTVYGCNAGYPDGDWATRSAIWKFHQTHLCGLTHFLRTDPAVPDELRAIATQVRLRPGPFDQTRGWPHQLYVREARRMISDYVVTQHDMAGTKSPKDSVGLASYGVDDFPYATYAHNGGIALSGGEFSILYLPGPHNGIYRIPYSAIRPRARECTNLLVPLCVSASHIAMTSIRMEPVWMILGESAGVAASMAMKDRIPVQDVEYAELAERLRELKQRLEPS
ncbi:MAG: FAD-dependent oxidoreductase [Verrucomicrobia bacterium]|nr:FAD-dependent oxidoreductase [Verrucomicrobiota bacterium]